MIVSNLTKQYNITYPIYKDMDTNYDIIYDMALEFYGILSEKSPNKDINLIFTGSSGCLMSAIFFAAIKSANNGIKIDLIYIRKKGEVSHEVILPERDMNRINIYLDDHIFSGDTLERCHKEVSSMYGLNNFKFDYAVVSWISNCKADKFKNINNLIYSYSVNIFK